MIKKKTINIPIFFGKLVITITDDITIYNKKFNIEASNNYEAYAFDYTSKKDDKEYNMVFRNKRVRASVIAHEAVHVVNMISKHVGLYHDNENDECQAYLTGWIVDQVNEFFYKNNL